MMVGRAFYDDRSRFPWRQVKIFIMTDQNFRDESARSYYERSRFSWWQVKIFMMIGRDFIINGWDFHNYWSRFSWWQVEIFMMASWDFPGVMVTCRDFHGDKSRYLRLQVQILLSTVKIFLKTGRDFHDDKSRFWWWQVEIFLLLWPNVYPLAKVPRTGLLVE